MCFNIIIYSPQKLKIKSSRNECSSRGFTFSQACMGCSSKLSIMLTSLVLMSTYKTVLKENTRQCLQSQRSLDLMWDAVQYSSWKLHCLNTELFSLKMCWNFYDDTFYIISIISKRACFTHLILCIKFYQMNVTWVTVPSEYWKLLKDLYHVKRS